MAKNYTFVFSFAGECCQRPHLWGITKSGRSRREALNKAQREITKTGGEVYEVVEVTNIVGNVEEA